MAEVRDSTSMLRAAILTALAICIAPTPSADPATAAGPYDGYSDCCSSCEASGCGALVGGGCAHLCAIRDPSDESTFREMSAHYREAASLRSLDVAAKRSSIIGIARVARVSNPGRYEFTAELEFIDRWKSDGTDKVILDGSYQDDCEDTWQTVREGQLGIFFLEPSTQGKYRIAGLGWAHFEVSDPSLRGVATGDPPLPNPVKATLPSELRRSGGWRAPTQELHDYVASLLRSSR